MRDWQDRRRRCEPPHGCAALDAAAEGDRRGRLRGPADDAEALVAERSARLEVGGPRASPEVVERLRSASAAAAEHEPLAYILGQLPLPRDRGRRRRAGADPRAARPSCWSRSASSCPQGARVHEVGHRVRRDRPRPAQRAPRPAGHRLGPLRRRRPRRRARTPHASASTLEVSVDEGLPEYARGASTCVIANLPYVTDDDDLRALAGDPARAGDRRDRRVRRRRPRRDPRPARRDAVRLAAWRSSTTPTTARRCASCCATPTTLHGLPRRRAGDGRLRSVSDAASKVEPSEGSTESVRREKLERLRAEGIEPYPRAGSA